MKKRVRKRGIETLVLFKNKHTCCICRDYKNYQEPILHHIDGNPANTVEENLAVLCPNHASMADAGLRRGKLGAGRKLSPQDVSIYKRSWEARVSTELKTERRQIAESHKKRLITFYEFEVSKLKNEILTLRDAKAVKQRYDFLGQLSIEEAISGLPLRKLVLDAYSDIAVQTTGTKSLTLPLLKALPDLFSHLVDPKEVPLYPEDKRYLLKVIDILETLGSYGAYLARDIEILRRAGKLILEFVEVANWYGFKQFMEAATKTLKKIRRECKSYTSRSAQETRKERLIRTRMVNDFLHQIPSRAE